MALDTNAAWKAVASGWETGDFSALEAAAAADVAYHMPPIGDFDRDGVVEFIKGFRQAYPDFSVTCDQTIAQGDRVAWLWHCQATFTGESPVIPMAPTGNPTAATGTVVARFADGKIAEVWHHGDWLSWLQVPLG